MSFIDRFGRSRVVEVIVCVVLILGLTAAAVGTLVAGKLHYSNYWGGRVFAPFVLVVVIIVVAGLLASFLRREKPPKKLRGRAARKARQADKTTFPIDDYKKW